MRKIMLLFLSILMSVAVVLGQGTTGRLSGTVSGPDGALPGATVTAVDNNTGKETTVTANESGGFLIPQKNCDVDTRVWKAASRMPVKPLASFTNPTP